MNDFYEQAGKRIRILRERKKYTREQFAEMAEISPKFLYEIEKGKKGFSADTLYRISRALSTSSEYILAGAFSNQISEEWASIVNAFDVDEEVYLLSIIKLIHRLCSADGSRHSVR